VGVHYELSQPENLTTKVESITKAGLFSFLGGKRLYWLKIEIVIEMQIVEVLSMNEKVEHVVALPYDLKAGFNPVKFCELEEFSLSESFEE
jgi:hypothetical protein